MTPTDMQKSSPAAGRQPVSHEDVVRLVGEMEDAKISALLEIAPTLQELEEAIAWAEAESDVMGELEKPLSGPVSRVYEILMTRKETEEDERRD